MGHYPDHGHVGDGGRGLLVGFLVLETRVEAPLLPLRLFRIKTVAGSNAVGFLLGASFFGFIFVGTLYMQQVLGYSALEDGADVVGGIAHIGRLCRPFSDAGHKGVSQARNGFWHGPHRCRGTLGDADPGQWALLA